MARARRHAVEKAHENAERWLLTYADMITLLMVLFVVMYAISTTDLAKFTVLAQSFSSAFNTEVPQGTQDVVVSGTSGSASGSSLFDVSVDPAAGDFRAAEASIRDYAIAEGLAGDVSLERVPEGIAIRISETLLFQSGRASLGDASLAVIRKVARVVASLPNVLRIEGHTDDLPPSGPFYADNWRLSSARALAVLDALRSFGIAPERLAAAGYAGFQPLVPNTDDAARARNRRVDILILYPPAASPAPAPSGAALRTGGQP